MNNEMRLKRVRISNEMLMRMFQDKSEFHVRVVKGLPVGTKFVRITSENIAGIDIIVAHESFDKLNDGDLIPIHENPIFEQLE